MNLRTDGDEMTPLDYRADLEAGRIHREFSKLWDILQTITESIEMQTADEKAILDAADRINSSVTLINANLESLKSKVATLQDQASKATAFQPEDLSDEFQQLNAALNNLASVGQDVSTVVPGPSESPANSGPVEVTPINQDPANTATPTPLAGESGATDGDPVSEAPQPGTDPGNPGAVAPENPTPVVPSTEEGTATGEVAASDNEAEALPSGGTPVVDDGTVVGSGEAVTGATVTDTTTTPAVTGGDDEEDNF
jgi:hypothetical protein